MEDNIYFLKMEDELNFLKMEGDLIFFLNGRRHTFLKMEDDLNIFKTEDNNNSFEIGRRQFFFWKWKTTSFFFKLKTTLIFLKMEDYKKNYKLKTALFIWSDGRRPYLFDQMEDNLNSVVNNKNKQCNLNQIMQFKKNSTVTSVNLTNTSTKKV